MEKTNAAEEFEDDRETDLAWDEFTKLVAARRKKDEQAYYPAVYQPVRDEDIINNLVRLLKFSRKKINLFYYLFIFFLF